MVIAVICDAVAGLHQEDRERELKKFENMVLSHDAAYSSITALHSKEIARLEAKIDILTTILQELMTQQQQQQQLQQPTRPNSEWLKPIE